MVLGGITESGGNKPNEIKAYIAAAPQMRLLSMPAPQPYIFRGITTPSETYRGAPAPMLRGNVSTYHHRGQEELESMVKALSNSFVLQIERLAGGTYNFDLRAILFESRSNYMLALKDWEGFSSAASARKIADAPEKWALVPKNIIPRFGPITFAHKVINSLECEVGELQLVGPTHQKHLRHGHAIFEKPLSEQAFLYLETFGNFVAMD
jgi:hypothetical protein